MKKLITLKRKHRLLLGLEVTEHWLIAVALTITTNKTLSIKQVISIDIKTEQLSILAALQKAYAALPKNFDFCVLGLPYQDVIMKIIPIDSVLTHEQIYYHLRQQAAHYFGQPEHLLNIDFEDISATPAHKTTRTIRAVAARRQMIQTAVHLCRKAGFHINVIDVDMLAIARALTVYQNSPAPQCTAVALIRPGIITFGMMQKQHIYHIATNHVSSQQRQSITSQQLQQLLQRYQCAIPDTMPEQMILFGATNLLQNHLVQIKKLCHIPVTIAAMCDSNHQQQHAVNIAHCCGLALWEHCYEH